VEAPKEPEDKWVVMETEDGKSYFWNAKLQEVQAVALLECCAMLSLCSELSVLHAAVNQIFLSQKLSFSCL